MREPGRHKCGLNPYVRRGVIACLCALGALCIGGPAAAQQDGPPWWDRAWQFRKLLAVPEDGAKSCRLWILTGERARKDGRDIRVVGPAGEPAPFSIVQSTPEGRHLISFDLSAGAAEGEASGEPYAIYFGNPRGVSSISAQPRAGLILETRAIPEPDDADVDSWEAAQQTLRKARILFGRDFHHAIFDAHNPFGRQSDYISHYYGYIQCAKGGKYGFATVSDSASFLLIDGKPVAEWPGRGHKIQKVRRGEHSGPVPLEAGVHRIRYVAFSFGGHGRRAAAWAPPGSAAKEWRIIPFSAFTPAAEALVVECNQLGRSVCADFGWQPRQYLEVGDARMVTVEFTSYSTAAKGTIVRYEWDFGDGQKSAAQSPVHAFLAGGVHKVKLTVGTGVRKRHSFTAQVDVRPIYGDLNFPRRTRERFLGLVKGYKVATLPTRHLLAYRVLMKASERRREAFDACLELNKRREELEPPQLYEVAMDLGAYYLDPLGEWEPAERHFRLALSQVEEGAAERRLEVRFRLAELYFLHKGDMERAQLAYEDLRRDFPRPHDRRHRALIRLGDIQRSRGKLPEARRIYEEAEANARFAPKQPRAVAEGQFRQQAEAFLRVGEGERALETVDQWEWHLPTRRLDGEGFVLRMKAGLLLGDLKEVRRLAGIYIGFANEVDYLPHAHALAGEAANELGDPEGAREHWQAVLDRWPESPFAIDAENGLYGLDHPD